MSAVVRGLRMEFGYWSPRLRRWTVVRLEREAFDRAWDYQGREEFPSRKASLNGETDQCR